MSLSGSSIKTRTVKSKRSSHSGGGGAAADRKDQVMLNTGKPLQAAGLRVKSHTISGRRKSRPPIQQMLSAEEPNGMTVSNGNKDTTTDKQAISGEPSSRSARLRSRLGSSSSSISPGKVSRADSTSAEEGTHPEKKAGRKAVLSKSKDSPKASPKGTDATTTPRAQLSVL